MADAGCGVLLSTCFFALFVADLIVGMEELELHCRRRGRYNFRKIKIATISVRMVKVLARASPSLDAHTNFDDDLFCLKKRQFLKKNRPLHSRSLAASITDRSASSNVTPSGYSTFRKVAVTPRFLKVARLQSEFCTKHFYRATNFLTKMLRNFPRNF